MTWYQTAAQIAILLIDAAMFTAALWDYCRPHTIVTGVEYRYR